MGDGSAYPPTPTTPFPPQAPSLSGPACAAAGPTPQPHALLWWPEWRWGSAFDPLIPRQVFISKGRGRATTRKRERKKDKPGEGRGKKSTSAANYWKNIKVFSVCVQRAREESEGEEEEMSV